MRASLSPCGSWAASPESPEVWRTAFYVSTNKGTNWTALGAGTRLALAHSIAIVCAFVIITALHMVLGEVVPKNLAVQKADHLAVLVAPPLNFGVSTYFLAYPGTLSLRVSTLLSVVEDLVRSAYRQGFRRILAHPKLRSKPFILETPRDKPGDDLRNVETLKQLCRKRPTITKPSS